MKILITGASGLAGSYAARLASKKHQVLACYNRNPIDFDFCECAKLDVENEGECAQVIGNFSPDWAIHSAAATIVDKCELEKEWAQKLNVDATRNVCKAAKKAGSRVLMISTDYVFDGRKKGGMYVETDATNPLSFYGKTKLEAEKTTLASDAKNAIARTSVIYGLLPAELRQQRKNFVTWLVDELMAGKKTKLVDDQINCPAYAGNLAEALVKICEKNLGGIFHSSGGERASRLDFGKQIAKEFGLDGKLLEKGKTSELKQPAPRPYDSSLNVKKLEQAAGIKMITCGQGLALMHNEKK
ncbi:RmlD substrate binding domain protein [Candidatus Gugararchaeum adminiculabundum]|nr:RmlD substrate binding domain protein [Candidatus Gugararchaeum adminiculabundum]